MHRKYCLRQSNELKGGSKTEKPWKDKKKDRGKEKSQTNSETMDQKTGQTKQMKEAEEKK